ncbi:hypothetical protein GCM10011492_14380 [Flexivirga endophytica]|uniref:Uncharacterized protein n=1 Tax=Flexivirga endophytica TaxID=1849103 RepID=A0A916T2C2_9MICO|nr:hypothetical protein [Flexivirga endophytica]GGB25438.1 hypothetical protein GCM10011492_14380 [Flexivirga endophytica]GHB54000.1 hypothetical protein GCM10008112_23700 [Flexivirga endophytica]
MAHDPTVTYDNRFTFGDDAYFLSEDLLGVPVASQHTWWLPEPLSAEALRSIHDGLHQGPLSRLVVESRVPGARRRWVPAPASDRLSIAAEPVPPEGLMAWCDEQLQIPVDPVRGPSWWLSATPVSGGGQLVSLVTRHTIGDGGLIVQAVDAAVTGIRLPQVPDERPGSYAVRLRDDLRDAAHQYVAAGRGLVDAVRALRGRKTPSTPDAPTTADRSDRSLRADPTSSYVPPFVAVDLSADAWRVAADARGGTSNSLLLMVSASLAVAAGLAQEGDTVLVAMPVRRRDEGDYRSNMLGGASVPVRVTTDRHADLRGVRAATKAELTRAADPTRTSVLDRLQPVARVLPRPVIRKIVEGMPASLVSVSNVGRMTVPGGSLGGPTALSMMCRGVHRNITTDLLRAAGGGVTTWLQEFGDRMTLTVEALAPDRIPDRERLAALVTEELGCWDVEPLQVW